MLSITIPETELFDESTQEFVLTKEQTLQLEHSLVSISKWESKWCKPFLSKSPKTDEETLDYIKCMTITQNVKPEVYDRLTPENIIQIYNYMNAPMTATTFHDDRNSKTSNEQVTNEIIYYWMTILNIPIECQKWHFNRLMTLIRVCNIKNQPPKRMSKRELLSRNRALNEARKKQLNTNG